MSFLTTVLKWFEYHDTPTESQFNQVFNWLRWKDETIPTSEVQGLDGILAGKAERSVLNAVQSDVAIIKTEVAKGLKVMDDISLDGVVSQELVLPENAVLTAIRINGASTITVGSSGGLDDIGDSAAPYVRFLEFGFLPNTSVWIKSDTEVTVTPIIFQM